MPVQFGVLCTHTFHMLLLSNGIAGGSSMSVHASNGWRRVARHGQQYQGMCTLLQQLLCLLWDAPFNPLMSLKCLCTKQVDFVHTRVLHLGSGTVDGSGQALTSATASIATAEGFMHRANSRCKFIDAMALQPIQA